MFDYNLVYILQHRYSCWKAINFVYSN